MRPDEGYMVGVGGDEKAIKVVVSGTEPRVGLLAAIPARCQVTRAPRQPRAWPLAPLRGRLPARAS